MNRFSLWISAVVFAALSGCSTGANRGLASVDDHSVRIVAFGDSHLATYFGLRLDRLLRKIDDALVNFYSSAGSTAKWWWSNGYTKYGLWIHEQGMDPRGETKAMTPQLLKPWKDFDEERRMNPGILTKAPTHVIVEFGANYWGIDPMFMLDELKKLVNTIKDTGAKCYFITLPDTRIERVKQVQSEIVKTIREAAGDYCNVFDSTDPKVTAYPPKDPEGERPYDGLHYNRAGELQSIAEKWADAVFADFKKHFGF